VLLAPVEPAMDRRRHLASLLAATGGAFGIGTRAAASNDPSAGPCPAVAQTTRVALLEVYSSEGCSSCPPADRWLARIAAREPQRVAALALHVKYWDYIGWTDPYAQTAFAERQRWLVAANGARTLYTPGVFVGGREWRHWHDEAALARRLDAWSRAPAPVRIDLSARGGTVLATASRQDSSAPFERPALFVALTESGLASKVTAGENRGETLRHDHVVRSLAGPQPFDAAGRATLSVQVPEPGATGRRLAAVAFVQDLKTAESLQAASLRLDAACLRG
jgi:hypothetical protein